MRLFLASILRYLRMIFMLLLSATHCCLRLLEILLAQLHCDRQKQQWQSLSKYMQSTRSQSALPSRVHSHSRRGTNQHLAWPGRCLLPSRDQTRPRDPAVKERRPAIDSRVCVCVGLCADRLLGNHLLLKTLLTRYHQDVDLFVATKRCRRGPTAAVMPLLASQGQQQLHVSCRRQTHAGQQLPPMCQGRRRK